MGKSRAAAFALGLQDIDEGAHINSFSESNDSHDETVNETAEGNSSYSLSFFLMSQKISYYLK